MLTFLCAQLLVREECRYDREKGEVFRTTKRAGADSYLFPSPLWLPLAPSGRSSSRSSPTRVLLSLIRLDSSTPASVSPRVSFRVQEGS